MAYTLTWEEEGVLCSYDGTITNDDLVGADSQIVNHPNFTYFRYGIADFSNVKNVEIESDGVTQTSQSDRKVASSNPDFRVAIVAPATVMKGFARMWELTGGADVWETKIFDDLDSARSWLKS